MAAVARAMASWRWPHSLVAWVALAFLALSALTRLVLMAMSWPDISHNIADWARMWLVGFGADVATLSFALIGPALADLLLPRRWPWLVSGAHRLMAGVILFSMLFLMAVEIVFWREFAARFDFIAVDYLVYTHEVLANIRQSYPVGSVLAGLAVVSGLVVWRLRGPLAMAQGLSVRQRGVTLLSVLLLAAVAGTCWTDASAQLGADRPLHELARNGLWSLVSAYRHNELDYKRYYPIEAERQVRALLREARVAPALFDEVRTLPAVPPPAPPHLIMITVESLSADFLGGFGNRQQLTPNLDRLAQEGISFQNLYAVGTRTVRGLEALSLSIPPTPGQSIVRRPGNEGLATLGEAFGRQGYHSHFLYGGYGYFDNMNYFFSHNGYDVHDLSDVPREEQGFTNAWGMADEYTYGQALKIMDAAAARQPQFQMIMTTSNHRPYSYPDGRIDLPSPGGREGAVKYTDWAIGDFIAKAKTRPWFQDTIFVIVADHCASSAGKTSLPIERYHIPAIVYAPGRIAPQAVTQRMSQIDIAPTVLALVGLPAEPRFFGRNILTTAPGEERAFIANYQELGYWQGDKLVVLAPRQRPHMYRVVEQANGQVEEREVSPDSEVVRKAIAYYQGASASFRRGWLKLAPLLRHEYRGRS